MRRSFAPPASTAQPSTAPPPPSGATGTNSTGSTGGNTAQSPATQPGSTAGAASGGAAQSKEGLHPAQRDPEPSQSRSEQDEQDRAGERSGGGGTANGTASGGTPQNGESKAGGSVLSLSPEEIEKIRRVIASYSIAPPERARFQMRIGALVPGNVDLKPIPPELKDVIPDHQTFSYIRTPGQIAIVITDKREIDVLIPV